MWKVEPYSESGGYDCMYGGITVGPVTLDGRDYGQGPSEDITPEVLAQMTADARLIGRAPEMHAALVWLSQRGGLGTEAHRKIAAALGSPEPDFCSQPEKCAERGRCTRDPVCNN